MRSLKKIVNSINSLSLSEGKSQFEILKELINSLSLEGCRQPASSFKGLPSTSSSQEVSVLKASEIYGVSTKTIKRRIQANKLRPSRVSPQGKNCKKFYYLADIETLFSAERQ